MALKSPLPAARASFPGLPAPRRKGAPDCCPYSGACSPPRGLRGPLGAIGQAPSLCSAAVPGVSAQWGGWVGWVPVCPFGDSVGCVRGGGHGCVELQHLPPVGNRRGASGFGEWVSTWRGQGGGKLRQGVWVPFLFSPHHADSSVASVESFRSPSWYFSTHKSRGMMLPSPPQLWQPAVMAAVGPRDMDPPTPHPGEIPSPVPTAGPVWLSDALAAGQAGPDAPKMLPPVPCPPELSLPHWGLGWFLGGFFLQFVLMRLAGSCWHPASHFSSLELGNWRGPQPRCKPGAELSNGSPRPAPQPTPHPSPQMRPEGCDMLWLSPGIVAQCPACPALGEWQYHLGPWLLTLGKPLLQNGRGSPGT